MARRSKHQGIHNNFFLQTFTNPENLLDFLETALPSEIAGLIDFSWAVYTEQQFIQPDLHSNAADLIVMLQTRSDVSVDIYLLLEHKSWTDHRTWLQIMHYQQLIWNKDLREKRPLRIVVPLILYHGKRPWKLAESFAGQFRFPPQLAPYVPD